MKKTNFLKSLFTPLSLAFLLAFSVSCSDKDDDVDKPVKPAPITTVPDSLAGEFKVSFNHTANGQPLVINTPTLQYSNSLNQPYKVTMLKYFISNVKLINSQTGKSFAEPNSYHLMKLEEGKTSFSFTGIPVKTYDKVEFSIGVDPVQNTRTDHKGDLDPTSVDDMAWDWNSGYVFFKLDGFTSNIKGLGLHIGGSSNYKTLTFPLNQDVTFQKGKPVTANVTVNLDELFHNPNVINFDTVYSFMGGPYAKLFAENYADGMFNVVSISQ